MAITEVDSARAEAFAGRTVQILNDAMLSLLLSVGHQTRLLDVMAEQAGVTSEELAQAAGLDERYVREWLAGLTVGRHRRARSRDEDLLTPARARRLPDTRRGLEPPRLVRAVRVALPRATPASRG